METTTKDTERAEKKRDQDFLTLTRAPGRNRNRSASSTLRSEARLGARARLFVGALLELTFLPPEGDIRSSYFSAGNAGRR